MSRNGRKEDAKVVKSSPAFNDSDGTSIVEERSSLRISRRNETDDTVGPSAKSNKKQRNSKRKPTMEKKHECPQCGSKHTTKYKLAEHLKRYHSGPRSCTVCSVQFPHFGALEKHWAKYGKYKHDKIIEPVEELCTYCLKPFESRSAVITHKNEMRRKKDPEHDRKLMTMPTRCEICERTYYDRVAWKRHYIAVHIKNILCEYCGAQFFTSRGNVTHIRQFCKKKPGASNKKVKKPLSTSTKRSGSSSSEDDESQQKDDTDESVGKKLNNIPKIKLPRATRQTTDPSTRRCVKKTKGKRKQIPKKDSLDKTTKRGRPTQPFFTKGSCENCHQTFATIQQAKKHIEVSHKNSPFPCQACIQRFDKKEDFELHMQERHETKLCEICGKICLNQDQLERHQELVH